MEIIDQTKDKQKEQWQLGDVLADNDDRVGLIVKK